MKDKLSVAIDIEALLDVRYGTLVGMDSKYKDEVLFKFTEYCNRVHDVFNLIFPELKMADWDVNYNSRSKDVLMQSPRTNVFTLVDSALRSSVGYDRSVNKLDISLLTNGYDLTEEEQETFKLLISSRFDHNCEVTIDGTTIDSLTPEYINSKFNLLILYDFNRWFHSYHGESILKRPNPKTVIYTPINLPDPVKSGTEMIKDFRKLKVEGDPMTCITDALSYYVNVQFVDARYFAPMTLV